MPVTYEPLATASVSGVATYTFSSIPSTYTDLRLVFYGSASTTIAVLQFNGDANSNYSGTALRARPTGASYDALANLSRIYCVYNSLDGFNPASIIVDILGYASTSDFKSVLIQTSADQSSNAAGSMERSAGLYRSTSAISSITLLTNSGGNFTSGNGVGTSVVTLYGIKAA